MPRQNNRIAAVIVGLGLAGFVLMLGFFTLVGIAMQAAPKKPQPASEKFVSGGKTIPVERFAPKQAGKYPAILLVHGADGFALGGQHYRQMAQAVADKGYVVFLVHYFERTDTKWADLLTMIKEFATWMK